MRRALLGLAFLLATFSLSLLLTGGFASTVAGVRISARSPQPAAWAASVALLAWLAAAHRAGQVSRDLAGLDGWLSSRTRRIVLVMAAMGGAVATRYGTFSAAGADASGYLSQATLWISGRLARVEPLAALATWPDAAATLTPLGWRAAADGVTQVPTYAPGLPLMMAPLHVAGGGIGSAVIGPLSFGVAIAAVGALAHRAAGPKAAVLASVWLATSPVALVAAMQPMSDVPATAAWLLCWVRLMGGFRAVTESANASQALVAGALAAAAILIRPNLAPLAVVPVLYLLMGTRSIRAAAAFSAPVLVAGLAVGFLQWRWFGSPLRSGYGTAEEIYALANVAPNAALYTRWLLDTHGPWLLAAPLSVLLVRGRELRWLILFAALVVCAYLVYAVFEVWTYLRFVLPALAIAMIGVATIVARLVAALPVPARAPAVAVLVLAVASLNLASSRAHDVFRLADRHARASLTGRYLDSALLTKSVIVSGEQSGALRYYTERSILRWEVTPPETFVAAADVLRRNGYDVWIALDEWEEEPFRRKFTGTAEGALDWPPQLDAGSELRTRAWRVRDRPRYMNGERIVTDQLR